MALALRNAQLAAPTSAACSTATTGGTLAASTYYYQVSALDASGGETTAFAEVSQITTGATSTVTVNWVALNGAVGYRIYGRATGAELFMIQVGPVNKWVDTGAITPAGALVTANTTAANSVFLHGKNGTPYIAGRTVTCFNPTSAAITLTGSYDNVTFTPLAALPIDGFVSVTLPNYVLASATGAYITSGST